MWRLFLDLTVILSDGFALLFCWFKVYGYWTFWGVVLINMLYRSCLCWMRYVSEYCDRRYGMVYGRCKPVWRVRQLGEVWGLMYCEDVKRVWESSSDTFFEMVWFWIIFTVPRFTKSVDLLHPEMVVSFMTRNIPRGEIQSPCRRGFYLGA